MIIMFSLESYIPIITAIAIICTSSTSNVSSFTFHNRIQRNTGCSGTTTTSRNRHFIGTKLNNNNHKNNNNNNNNIIKPPFSTSSSNNNNEWDDDNKRNRQIHYMFNETTTNMTTTETLTTTTTNEKQLENENVDDTSVTMLISRGGSSSSSSSSSSSTANNNGQNQQQQQQKPKRRVEFNKRQKQKGGSSTTNSQSPVTNAIQYWKKLLETSIIQATIPFQQIPTKVSNVFKSQKLKDQDQLMEKLRTVTIKKVIIKSSSGSSNSYSNSYSNSNSNTNNEKQTSTTSKQTTTVVPKDVIDIAVRSCNMIGSPLRSNIVSDFAEIIKRWYIRNGYILHNVIGATLLPDSGTAEIQVDEPYCSPTPVNIIFVKEMIYDNSTKELLSIKQYKEKYFSSSSTPDRISSSSSSSSKQTQMQSTFNKNQHNITYIVTNGRTKAQRIADALQLYPYQSFQWQSHRWNTIKNSGLFNSIIDATPKSFKDGSVQLCIVATEAPCRHLEYGVGKSLYTGIWEGEIDFEHTNVLGGGETIGISIKRQAPPLSTSTVSTVSQNQQRVSVPESFSSSSAATTTTTNFETDTDTAAISKEKGSFFRNILSQNSNNKNKDATSNSKSDTNNHFQSSQIQPSIRIKYSDGRLQQDGGYNVELFRDYLLNINNNSPTILKKDDTSPFKYSPKNSKSTGTSTSTSSNRGSRNAVTWLKRRRMRQQQKLNNNHMPPGSENDIDQDMISSSSSSSSTRGSSVPILAQQQQQKDPVNVDETHYDIYSSTSNEVTGTATTTATMDSTTLASSSTPSNSSPVHDDESVVNDNSHYNYENNDVDDTDNDVLYDRRGATIRFNNPIDTSIIQNSIASASIEQITTINGNTEAIGSTTWDIGPFSNQLPLINSARTNFDFSITAGTRIARQRQRLHQQHYNNNNNDDEVNSNNNKNYVAANDNVDDTVPYATVNRGGGGFMGRNRKTNNIVLETKVLPFSTISATTRQIFPLFDSTSSNNNNSWNRFRSRTITSSSSNNQQQPPVQQKRSIVVAFKHGVIVSTPNLPRHTMQAHGTVSTIRGLDGSIDPTGRVSSALQGTVELRVPVQIPDIRIVRTPNTKFGFTIQRFNNNNNLNMDNNIVVTANGTQQQAIIPMQSQSQQQQRQQDGSVVVFSDWAITTQDFTINTIHRKSNIGVGIRKTISGLPVQYDITYIHTDKKIKASFGLGKDFDF